MPIDEKNMRQCWAGRDAVPGPAETLGAVLPGALGPRYQKEFYEATVRTHNNPFTNSLSIFDFCENYGAEPWRIGPFREEKALAFRKPAQWQDPLGLGWQSHSLINPTVLPYNDGLLMMYRATPLKESLASRIGLAVYRPGAGWTDSPRNPAIFPTLPWEAQGCEDPKLYRHESKYYLYYQGVWPTTEAFREWGNSGTGFTIGEATTSTLLAVSSDLVTWEKKGPIVPFGVSKGWSKGAVIPRNGNGEAVKIDGKYLMYLSEGCGGRLHVGCSTDMESWTFSPVEYLHLPRPECNIEEVACASVGADETTIVLDFYYQSPDRVARAGQALYSVGEPFRQLDVKLDGGTLSWGGMCRYNGKWLFAQGWDAAPGAEELAFYSAEIRPFSLNDWNCHTQENKLEERR